MDPAIDLTVRAALALLFVVAAVHKLRDLRTFQGTFADYRLLPDALSAAVARAVPLAELLVAALLVAPSTGAMGKVGAAGLLIVYAAAVGVNLLRGRRHIDCGCAGPHARRPIGGAIVVRNALIAAAALVALAPVEPRPLVWVDALTVSGAVLALAALYLAADRLMALAPALARLREAA
jgi:methylamine utilization protein MauE